MHDKAQQLIDAIAIPAGLNERQAQIAQRYAKSKMMDGHTIAGFCSENGISTKTFYLWMEDAGFRAYLSQIQIAVVPSSEKDAYAKIKLKILQIAEKENPSIKEIELFTDTFAYVVEADKKERMEALGLNNPAPSRGSNLSIEERQI